MANTEKLWVEKYRPTSFDDYVFHDEKQKNQIMSQVESRSINHLLFYGVQGSGKTTLAKIIIDALEVDDMDVMVINGSDENSVDVMREKIKNFAGCYAFGDFKIIQLEEMDYLSPSAQACLRNIMDECADNCRFIATCNYDNKISAPIKSRFQKFYFKAPDVVSVAEFAGKILINEGVDFEIDVMNKFISANYPDIRQIINQLQQHTIDGKLQPPSDQTTANDYNYKILDLIDDGDFGTMRSVVCQNVPKEEYEKVYRLLYENLDKCKTLVDKNRHEVAIVKVANYLYRHNIVADTEINLAALLIELNVLAMSP